MGRQNMIEIKYDEKPCVFYFLYSQKEYIPKKFFDVDMYAKDIELNYFVDLLTRNKMLSPHTKGTPMIWTVHYPCSYRRISFIMVYDEDYGFVSFAVANSKDRVKIAETIKHIMENELAL